LSGAVGDKLSDSFDYEAEIVSAIKYDDKELGLVIGKIGHKNSMNVIGREIAVISLKRLLGATFKMTERKRKS
jgi:hypothetical protein